ncbi:hypothetical protein COO91_00083 [Nostoc flagelliforme CCNUN1]|uniref:Uncharacterized protein n=1 Tax=Nostoc flagelliforme CCNUN1 TaxID=2038116 RepID=A0A2K8SFY2_9NOSO|nr:hypothetical protein COO91_00022 [Nostoc flagelliforme CCNUN1]AUB34270.1 hypothetical protein COO91_00083 [Nostoc flagelliforme CCNUN1]
MRSLPTQAIAYFPRLILTDKFFLLAFPFCFAKLHQRLKQCL